MNYKLIVMSFDGDYKVDCTGDLETCQNRSADMGSKWFFYPFHFITTVKGTVADCRVGLVELNRKKPYSVAMFKGRRLSTVQKIFQQTQAFCERKGIEVDPLEFEHEMIDRNHKLIRWHVADTM